MKVADFYAIQSYRSRRTYYDIEGVLKDSYAGRGILGYDFPWDFFDDGTKDMKVPREEWETSSRIEIRCLADVDFDGNRGLTINTVWLDDVPVALIRRAGRSLCDERDYYITNNELVGVISDLLRARVDVVAETLDDEAIVGAEDHIPGLARFYGYDMRGIEDWDLRWGWVP